MGANRLPLTTKEVACRLGSSIIKSASSKKEAGIGQDPGPSCICIYFRLQARRLGRLLKQLENLVYPKQQADSESTLGV